MLELKDKIVIITGGTGLLGSSLSKKCAEQGAEVIILDIDEKRGKNLIAEIKKEFDQEPTFFKCDITNKKQIKDIIGKIIEKFGKIDGLINSAYPRNKNYGRKYDDVEFEDFCENINLHLGGYFLMTKLIAQEMKKQGSGSIVTMNSIYGFKAPRFEIYEGTEMTMPVEYATIKGALLNLDKYLSTYFKKSGIRFNSVSPGGVFDNQPKAFVKKYLEHVCVNNSMTETNDILNVTIFLISDKSKYITGQNMVVDGGWTL